MKDWKINNHSNRHFAIQRNTNEISIVEPQDNGSFKILGEIDIQNNNSEVYDDNLYISFDANNKELNIFDRS